MGSLLNGYGSSSFAARGAADFLPRAESLLPGASEAHVQCTALDVDSRVTRVYFECFTRHGVPAKVFSNEQRFVTSSGLAPREKGSTGLYVGHSGAPHA